MKTKKYMEARHKINKNKLVVIFISFIFIIAVLPTIKSDENFSPTWEETRSINSPEILVETDLFNESLNANVSLSLDTIDSLNSTILQEVTNIPGQLSDENNASVPVDIDNSSVLEEVGDSSGQLSDENNASAPINRDNSGATLNNIEYLNEIIVFDDILLIRDLLSGGHGTIWTTRNDCGDSSQDVNHYNIGDHVFINGENFDPSTSYKWSITGRPGGASCDPGEVVASDNVITNENGNFCFDAYTIQLDDCGEYQVKVGNKGDSYQVNISYAPVVGDIPDQLVAEGSIFAMISLDDYVSDVDDTDAEMVWVYSGNSELSVSIVARVATITIPGENWFGAETITFRAVDPDGLWDEDVAIFTVTAVNDGPVVGDIPDQLVAEGSIFAMISLDDYVSDVDDTDAEIVWVYSGNSELSVSIVARVATITIPSLDWNGAETITFKATDPGALFDDDAALFTVTAENDPPVVSGISDQTIAEGSTFATINLDDYVTDVDNTDAQMTWTYSGNSQLTVSIVDRVATIGIHDLDWNGVETITFTATDSGGLSDFDDVVFTVTAVNDPPVLDPVGSQSGDELTLISFTATASDVDIPAQTLTFSLEGGVPSGASIGELSGVFEWTPSEDQGPAVYTFDVVVSDGIDSDSETITITVDEVNLNPVIDPIGSKSIEEETLLTFTATASDDDIPIQTLAFRLEDGNSGNVPSGALITSDGIFTWTPTEEQSPGVYTFDVVVKDDDLAEDRETITVTVDEVNDPPIVSNIPDQTVLEGETFKTINLDDYVEDVDDPDGDIEWSYSGNVELSVDITDRVATITIPDTDWNGQETITFRATDTGLLWDEDAATFTVTAENDPPVVNDILDQTINEGQTFTTINLDNYVTDVDNLDSEMTWTYTGNTELTITIADRIATITIPNENWNGAETITFIGTDPGGLYDEDAATFTVTAENDLPVVSDIPDQTIFEGASFVAINLDDYVMDVEDPDVSILWSYSGTVELSVDITGRIASIGIPDLDWNGQEAITFRATDTGGLWDDDPVTFTVTNVNDPPVVTNIPDQTIAEGSTFVTINLDDYVSDIDNTDAQMTWTYSGNVQLTVSIVNRVATITVPNADWYGVETITFKATDPGGLWDDDPATFTVTAVNDPPVANPDSYSTNEDTTLTIPAPGVLGNDVDIDGDTLTAVKTSGPTHGTVTLNANGSFSYLPFADYNGDDSFTYKTYDGEDYSNIATVTILITSVNDLPNAPSHPYPNDNATNIDINIILHWRGAYPGSPYEYDPDGDPVTFDIYFGTNNSPPLMVHNQSNTSYDPILNYNTVYYWKIIAWDNHNASNASEIWRFTTQEQSTGGGGSSNKKPVADSSAGKPYQGYINEEITFNGSRSYDPDGTIISWYWTFGDGTHGNGKTTTHTYLNEGTYHATLTVTDNNGDTGTDSFTVVIVKANHPPSIPSIDGPVTGHQNSTLEFTALSFDADNDTIQYIFDWGDGETTRTGFLQNGTVTHQTHQWATYGEYLISVSAFDNESESGAATYSVLIDVIPIDDEIKGYLVDEHSENTYNVFDNTATGRQTSVEKEDNSTYLIDSDGNGKWDYAFNLKTGLVPYSTYVYQKYYALYQNAKTPGFEALSVLAMLVLVVIILRRRRTI